MDLVYRFALPLLPFHPVPFRSSLPPGCGVVGFVLCTIPAIHYHILLVSTALVGATAFMLGVDCFTTAGLKEVSHQLRSHNDSSKF
jgi:hypothetical protein